MLDKKLQDKIATGVIKLFGVGTLASIFFILYIIVAEFLPLFESVKTEKLYVVESKKEDHVLASNMDVYFENMYKIKKNGTVDIIDLKTNSFKEELKLTQDGKSILGVNKEQKQIITVYASDKSLSHVSLKFKPVFDKEGKREIKLRKKVLSTIETEQASLNHYLSRTLNEEVSIFMYVDNLDKLYLNIVKKFEDFSGEIVEESDESILLENKKVSRILASADGKLIYALTEDKKVHRWTIDEDGELDFKEMLNVKYPAAITASCLMLSGEELVLGYEDGHVEVYSVVYFEERQKRVLVPIHEMKFNDGKIEYLKPSPRNRTLAIGYKDKIDFIFTTNERHLLTVPFAANDFFFSSRGKSFSLMTSKGVEGHELFAPHPEINIDSLFKRVWYSGYSEPDFTWQSSSGSDDFEIKLSFIPLVFGSFKAALYALIFAVILSVLSAIYISQFAGKQVKSFVKPIIEILSTVPSVMVGFIIALWLSPLLDKYLLVLFVSLAMIPVYIIFMVFVARSVSDIKFSGSIEFILALVFVPVFLILSHVLSGWIDGAFFGGDFNEKFKIYMDGTYDMRNSIVISIGMGFAVIPIIFSMAEDALSNVPKGLTSASYALGASPWQTVWNVVLPAAVPGILSGCILGFGRAVGETMIVLMATGNTPIIDMNIFNGLRALSANIAVEMPEAPVGGTLYRSLFLSAALLLVFTSIMNTMAEIIRNKINKNLAGGG